MTPDQMTDEQLHQAVAAGDLPAGTFGHLEHVRVAWWLVREGSGTAGSRMREAIHGFTGKHGLPDVYHETKTTGWLRVLQDAVTRCPEATFAAFAKACPEVLDSRHLLKFWSGEVLEGADAKARWIEPDLCALP